MADMHIFDSADKVPPAPTGRHALAPIAGSDFRDHTPSRPTAQAWLTVAVVGALIAGALVWGAYSAIQSAIDSAPWLPAAIGFFLLAVAVLSLVGLALTLGARGWVSVQRARLVRTAHGAPVDVVAQMRLDPFAVEAQQVALYHAMAPYLQHPNLSTLSAPTTKGSDPQPPAQLATPLALVGDRDWLTWVNEAPHLMIAGKTNAGKTTLATAILNQRVAAGESLCVIDPHDQPSKWFGGKAIGGGRDYAAIAAALDGIEHAMDQLYDEYNAGRTDFDRLSILIDEVPAIVLRDPVRWEQFATTLGSEARKVNMSIIFLTQSPLVRDIKVSSVMLENFERLALGDQVIELLRDERDPRRRAQLTDLLRGQERPAAMTYRGEVHLLDTSNVPSLARQRQRARFWVPPVVEPVEPIDLTRQQVRAMLERGISRDRAREHGVRFANDTWSQVRKEVA